MKLLSFLIKILVLIKIVASVSTSTETQEIIELKTNSNDNLILKSAFKYLTEVELDQIKAKYNRIIWSFKRLYIDSYDLYDKTIYSNDNTNELMISIDNDVDEKLSPKYLIQNYDLIIRNLSFKDTGLYICNLWNQKKIIYKVIVNSQTLDRPQLNVNKLQNNTNNYQVSFKEQDNLLLTCQTKHSYPFGKFKWFQNDIEMNLVKQQVKLIDRESLTIESRIYLNNISSNLNGNSFKCKIFYDQNNLSFDSNNVHLNITFKPIVSIDIINDNNNQIISINDTNTKKQIYLFERNNLNIKFKCNWKANPNKIDQIVWLKNGYLIKQDDNLINDDTYFIKQADRQFKNLTCIIKNSIGQGQTTIEIIFMYEPRVTFDKTFYELEEHKPLQVNCAIDSSPLVNEVIWKRLQDNRILSYSSLLEFKSLQREDAGIYVCMTKNYMIDVFNKSKIGYAELNIEISILFAPVMDSTLQTKQAIQPYTDTKLTCLTSSNPEPIFSWYKINPNTLELSKLNDITRTSLRSKSIYENTLTISKSDSLGHYKCVVSNRLGQNEALFELVPQQSPETPTELKVTQINLTRIQLEWIPEFDGGYEQTFQILYNDNLLNITHNNQVWLKNLALDTEYLIKIRSINQLGSSDWSKEVYIKTPSIDSNLNLADYLPKVDKIILNPSSFVVKLDLNQETLLNVCLKIFNNCFDVNFNESITFIKLNKQDLYSTLSNLDKNNNLKGYLCLKEKKTICDLAHAIPIEILNDSAYHLSAKHTQTLISIEVIVAISICILILLLILLIVIIYFMRKNQNLNKKNGTINDKKSLFNIIFKRFDKKQFKIGQQNKSFHIDIGQISAPISSSVSITNCTTTNSTVSSASLTTNDTKPLKVTEDEDKHYLNTNHYLMNEQMNLFIIPPPPQTLNDNLYSFSDLSHQQHTSMLVDAYNCSNSGTGSNSDPLVVNNSILTSSSAESESVDSSSNNSPTYGYNVTNAYQTKNQHQVPNYHQQQQQHHQKSTTVSTYLDAPESGYSTPSRLKKVVYEVIV